MTHVVPMHNAKLPPIDQYVAAPVVGLETLTLNVTNVGFEIVLDVKTATYLLLSFSR